MKNNTCPSDCLGNHPSHQAALDPLPVYRVCLRVSSYEPLPTEWEGEGTDGAPITLMESTEANRGPIGHTAIWVVEVGADGPDYDPTDAGRDVEACLECACETLWTLRTDITW